MGDQPVVDIKPEEDTGLLFDVGEVVAEPVSNEEVALPIRTPEPVDDTQPLPFTPLAGAEFSPDRRYRYRLWRIMTPSQYQMVFVGLNPSLADESVDDPTARRMMDFARRNGCGRMQVLNLFAYKSAHPEELNRQFEPFGPGNLAALTATLPRANIIVCCWGTGCGVRKKLFESSRSVVCSLLKPYKPMCLGLTSDGEPRHPLYMPAKSVLVPYDTTRTFKESI